SCICWYWRRRTGRKNNDFPLPNRRRIVFRPAYRDRIKIWRYQNDCWFETCWRNTLASTLIQGSSLQIASRWVRKDGFAEERSYRNSNFGCKKTCGVPKQFKGHAVAKRHLYCRSIPVGEC